MSAVTVQLRRRGRLTLPVSLRRKHGFGENDVSALEDLGNGSLLLVPRVSKIATLGDRVTEAMAEYGVSVEDVLEALDEEREGYS